VPAIGKLFIILGVVLVVVGLGSPSPTKSRTSAGCPDIYIKREKFSFYFPSPQALSSASS